MKGRSSLLTWLEKKDKGVVNMCNWKLKLTVLHILADNKELRELWSKESVGTDKQLRLLPPAKKSA